MTSSRRRWLVLLSAVVLPLIVVTASAHVHVGSAASTPAQQEAGWAASDVLDWRYELPSRGGATRHDPVQEAMELAELARIAASPTPSPEPRYTSHAQAPRSSPEPEPPPQPESEQEAPGPQAPDVPSSCSNYSGNRATGCAMLLDAGFEIGQMGCLDELWEHESGWNERAENPSSGAYGIPQSLPASKMASHGSDWQTNAATQIAWGLDYIANRYGTPCGAWQFWQNNNWY